MKSELKTQEDRGLTRQLEVGIMKTYSSNDYAFQYPATYSLKEPTQSSPVLVIEGENGRVEIFKSSNFGELGCIHGFSSSGLEIHEAKHVPKEKLSVEDYELWLFYLKDDEGTKHEVQTIAGSLILHRK